MLDMFEVLYTDCHCGAVIAVLFHGIKSCSLAFQYSLESFDIVPHRSTRKLSYRKDDRALYKYK